MTSSSQASATVTGRWTGTNRVQVRLEDGSSGVVESTSANADEVGPGDSVEVELDAGGQPVDWRRPRAEAD